MEGWEQGFGNASSVAGARACAESSTWRWEIGTGNKARLVLVLRVVLSGGPGLEEQEW